MDTLEKNYSLEVLAQRFEHFGQVECHLASPLYERLCIGIASDPEILDLAAYAHKGQPVPNLFLSAVQFLLLQGIHHPLATFYPNLSGTKTLDDDDPYAYFRSFCLEYYEQIQLILATHLVQTNEVRRSACLLPAFELVSRRSQRRPLALIEIGASAGLNLLWDRYGYDYGESLRCGVLDSPVQLTCQLRGNLRPPLPDKFPMIAYRVGIDLNPIDVRDPAQTLWLQALIWPEHKRRANLLSAAISIAQQHPPALFAGDALDILPTVLPDVAQDSALCIYHSFVINQFSPEAREHLDALFMQEAQQRDLYVVSIAWLNEQLPVLGLLSFQNGLRTEQKLANCSGHARWMEWL
jgi:hypothetical protein